MHAPWHPAFLLTVLVTVVVALTTGSFAANEYVVVAVDPPAAAPTLGTLYKRGDLIHVARGSAVTLMGDDGSVTTLRGPQDILVTEDPKGSEANPPQANPSKLEAISDLLANGAGEVQYIGASRSSEAAKQTGMHVWSVPLQDGMIGCIRDNKLELWRGTGETAFLSIGYDDQPPLNDLIWETYEPRITVPGNVPPGAKSASISLAGQTSRLVLKHLPSDISRLDNVGLYTWLISSGCAAQASALIWELSDKPSYQ